MTNQPYGGYGSYEPYQEPQAQGQGPGQGQGQAWPENQAYVDPYADQQYTQQWQGQTWETQLQPPVAPAPVAPAPVAPAPDPVGADGPEYGPATLGGNSRVTDAQRARAEGRSPIIEPGMQPAVLTALLCLLYTSPSPRD